MINHTPPPNPPKPDHTSPEQRSDRFVTITTDPLPSGVTFGVTAAGSGVYIPAHAVRLNQLFVGSTVLCSVEATPPSARNPVRNPLTAVGVKLGAKGETLTTGAVRAKRQHDLLQYLTSPVNTMPVSLRVLHKAVTGEDVDARSSKGMFGTTTPLTKAVLSDLVNAGALISAVVTRECVRHNGTMLYAQNMFDLCGEEHV